MLKSINVNLFAKAIEQSYKFFDESRSLKLAEHLINSLDEELEPSVLAWINGEEVPDVEAGNYSINKILGIRNSSDYLEAFTLFTEYKLDPENGEKKIWQPSRRRHR
ncbi:MAG: hypothetical protein IJU48_05195 [Synergistaceae bacterium]|nr:hypothetical protein [Synergistaceae bacterium]